MNLSLNKYLGALGAAFIIGLLGQSGTSNTDTISTQVKDAPKVVVTAIPTDEPIPNPTSLPTRVPTPIPTVYIPPPVQVNTNSGASAQCEDGTYSYSQHRRGTCSHHGGVAVWF